jgi:indolepyruvate ferredoxin oxidoreductase
MTLKNVTLDDKYDLSPEPRVRHRLSGADPRLPDAAGARPPRRAQYRGYVSGYRGSPLGGLDQQFMRAKARWSATTCCSSPA